MPKTKLSLEQYIQDVKNIINCAKYSNYRNREEIFSECFYLLNNNEELNSSVNFESTRLINIFKRIIIISFLLFTLAIVLYILLNFHQPTSSLVLRNVQSLIYPSLKFLRILSVPFIKRFTDLTGLYDESCLVENPYFQVHEMECWPCSDVFSVNELTTAQNQTMYMSGKPHITRTNQEPTSFDDLKNLFVGNKNYFFQESSIFESSNDKISHLGDLFKRNPEEIRYTNLHVSWRINRMSLARIVRSKFPRPETLPEISGQSVERFIMIDGVKATPYTLPSLECSYVGVRQEKGQRMIVLKPSPECARECRTLSVILNSSTILWYNWWYWRPVSLPVPNATDLAISYISSYC